MEKYNWIKAYYASQNDDSEREIFVRQMFGGSEYFVDKDGCKFHVSELDLTQNGGELIPVDKADGLKWLMQSMDANAIADHKAKIDEREYWRKLRGDIFLEVTRLRLQDTKYPYTSAGDYNFLLGVTSHCFKELYDQDQEFFKDK